MDLHRLTLRAIGPYAGEHSIDFAELGASGVFLLEGPTGSGKSTIIDAIVFGLYGSLAGSSSSVDRLHSHHAAADVEPFVELVFETGSGIYRIRRTPQWLRPKARGTGFTRANASASLVRLTSPDAVDGQPVSSSTQEIGFEMPGIVGLTREQFVQTVVLPQGEFARFLGSTGEERRLVLQSLFGTRIYDDTTEVLADMRRTAKAGVDAAQRTVDEALAGLRVAAGDDLLEIDGAAAAVAAFRDVERAAALRRDEARVRRDEAERRRAADARVAKLLDRRADLLVRQAALMEASPGADDARAELDLGRRGATVVGPAAAWVAAAEGRARASEQLSVVEAHDVALAAFPLDALVARRDRLLGELGSLSALVTLESGLAGRDDGIEAAAAAVDESSAAIADEEAARATRGEQRGPLAAEVEAAGTATAGLAVAERRVAELVERADLIDERARLVDALGAADARLLALAEAAHEAVDRESSLRRRRIDGMAGELAAQLIPGEPCDVCGSTSHPAPARLTDEHPTAEQIEQAASVSRGAEAAVQEHRDVRTALAAQSAEVERRLTRGAGGGLDDGAADGVDGVDDDTADGVGAALAVARAAVTSAREAVAVSARARSALEAFDAETASLAERLEAGRIRVATARERLEGERRSLHADRERVAQGLDGRAESCAALAAELGDEQDRASRLIEARRSSERAIAVDAERRTELESALVAAGFPDAEAARAASRPASELDALERSIARHDRDRQVVDEQLASDELAVVAGVEEVDVEASAVAASDAERASLAAADEASVAADRAGLADRALAALARAQATGDAALEQSRAVVRMADVAGANGPENLRGVTLGTYVLLRRFDDVVAAANTRLTVMSSGRYQLEASESRESSSRSRRTGLALAIRDNTTDTTRDPKSFSGGETFYASLSLALGLADVVQAEAGGVGLGTLFVDEGFGTLDPETLDAVMAELGRLSRGGRVVGIVSHVDELKQRIADRIEVRRRPDGSSTLRSTASARLA